MTATTEPNTVDQRALTGSLWAWLAFATGAAYTAISLYWALGGTWLLATVSASLADDDVRTSTALVATIWAAVVVKAAASVLPLAALRAPQPTLRRLLRRLAWVQAVILIGYGGVLTVAGLLVQAGAINTPADADRRALAWHAYLWDPWFLLWGVLVLATLRHSRCPREHN